MRLGHRGRRTATVAGVAAVAGLVLALLPAPFAAVAAAPGTPLRIVGELAEPRKDTERIRQGNVAAIDEAGRRMFYVYTAPDLMTHVVTYDLRPTLPVRISDHVFLPDANVNSPTPYSVAFDASRNRLVFITVNVDAGGTTATTGNGSLTTFDVATGAMSRWDLATIAPGFFAFGVNYSAADDRVYLVGEFSETVYAASATFAFGSKVAGATAILALDAEDGGLLWGRLLPQCQQALYTFAVGGLIARSSYSPALYVACVTGGTPAKQTYPGQAGLLRLRIDPAATDSLAALDFPVDFFAVSGNYFNGSATGIAAFDAGTDRFYLQSLSSLTPGAWVFDGLLSAWVGFVSAPSDANYYVGLNPTLGHLYMGTNRGSVTPEPTDGIIVADVRQTPVPAGEFQPLLANGFIVADPGSNRLFVRRKGAETSLLPYLVVEDTTPVTTRPVRVAYDTRTTDAADVPGAFATYAAGVAGYGAQIVQVGGTSGATSINPNSPDTGVPGGTRAVMGARVGGVDLRNAGSAASAQAVLSDINTTSQYETGGGGAWPYPTVSCLDSGGGLPPSSSSVHGSTASVACDLAGARAVASALTGEIELGTVSVGRSAYSASAVRTRKVGAEVRTTAAAEGTTFNLAGGVILSVGSVRASSTSIAHGRAGTTSATWSRVVEAVRLYDASGTTIFSAPGCATEATVGPAPGQQSLADTCADLAGVLNSFLQTRMRISFPVPALTATPRGAYAGVEQTEADYYQQRITNDQGVIYRGDSVGIRPAPALIAEVYNDSTERSRTVTALAATQSNAIFTIAPADRLNGGVAPGAGQAGDSQVAPKPGTGLAPPAAAQPVQPVLQAARPTPRLLTTILPRGWVFLRRKLGDTVLLALLAGLFAAAGVTTWRRRRLEYVLVTLLREDLP